MHPLEITNIPCRCRRGARSLAVARSELHRLTHHIDATTVEMPKVVDRAGLRGLRLNGSHVQRGKMEWMDVYGGCHCYCMAKKDGAFFNECHVSDRSLKNNLLLDILLALNIRTWGLHFFNFCLQTNQASYRFHFGTSYQLCLVVHKKVNHLGSKFAELQGIQTHQPKVQQLKIDIKESF